MDVMVRLWLPFHVSLEFLSPWSIIQLHRKQSSDMISTMDIWLQLAQYCAGLYTWLKQVWGRHINHYHKGALGPRQGPCRHPKCIHRIVTEVKTPLLLILILGAPQRLQIVTVIGLLATHPVVKSLKVRLRAGARSKPELTYKYRPVDWAGVVDQMVVCWIQNLCNDVEVRFTIRPFGNQGLWPISYHLASSK